MIIPKELFSLLSDETRLRCLLLILKEKELCVCEFTQVLDCIQPKISRHLALMRQSGLLLDERRGQWVYYRLNPESEKWVQKILCAVMDTLKTVEPYRSDLMKLKSLRKNCPC